MDNHNRRHDDPSDRAERIRFLLVCAVLAFYFACVLALDAGVQHDNINEKTEVGDGN